MARQPIHTPSPFRISQAPSLHNTFVKGLITEATEVGFPENACTDTFDCIFSPIGFVQRRPGFDYEVGGNLGLTQALSNTEAVTEFVWTSVNGDGSVSFLVQQVGATVYFFNISTSVTVSANRKSFTVNLTSLLPTGSGRDPSTFPLQYTSGIGLLHIASRAIKPTYITYNPTTDSISTTSYELAIRDFTGLNDGLTLTQRPTDTVAGIKTDNPAHFYNLLNQGWGEVGGAALTAWDTARADLPSNADFVALYRSSPTAIFDNNRVLNQDPLTTPAAKGHYVLNPANPDRNTAMQNDGFSGASITNPPLFIANNVGTIISGGGVAFNPNILFDGNENGIQNGGNCVTFSSAVFVGKNFTGIPKQINSATFFGSGDNGFQFNGGTGSVTIFLQASQTAPVNPTDGTNLGSVNFTNSAGPSHSITSNDSNTFWNYVWAYGTITGGGSPNLVFSEFQFFTNGPPSGAQIPTTIERPESICLFAGRLWYAGLNALGLNNTIFFTQILQGTNQIGQCYQVNDPTNENIFQLLPSDGGTIAIPEIGSIHKLFTYQNALLIFASNGVWMVTGGSSGGFGGGFQANDFFVKKLSSIGMSSPQSVVDRRGVPMWFGEDGIYTIQYNAQFNSFEVLNTTFKTIKTFYLNIPKVNQQFVKGTYDPVFDVVYWVYNSTSSPTISYSYSNVLLFNGIMNAFYPWTISRPNTSTDPIVRGVVAVADAARNNLTHIKFTTSVATGIIGQENLTYSEANSTTYQDWFTIAGNNVNYYYNSYMITAYKLDTMGQRYAQMNYVWAFIENVPNSSLFVQGLYDFANNANSGKWSTPQQAYNPNPAIKNNHAVDLRRLKIRGKGRSLQLKFFSDTNLPFQIQGWAVHDTMTLGV